jgi:hypothetical protein
MGQQAIVNQAAFDIGQMTERMVQGYFMHLAAIQVAKDPRAVALSPNVEPGQIVPVAYVARKDGTRHVFHFTHFLAQAGSNPAMVGDLDRVWLVGALLALGDGDPLRPKESDLSQAGVFERTWKFPTGSASWQRSIIARRTSVRAHGLILRRRS